jgi:hypothetical protein
MTADHEPTVDRSVRCAECGAENRASRFFCASCGAYLRREEDTWEGPESQQAGAPTAPGGPGERRGMREPARRQDLVPPLADGPLYEDDPHHRPILGAEPPAFERHLGDPAPLVPPPLPTGMGLVGENRSPEKRRRQRALGVLLALLLLLGLVFAMILVRAALNAPVPPPAAEMTTTTLEETTTTTAAAGAGEDEIPAEEEPTEEPRSTETAVELEPQGVTASSELSSEQGNSYAAANVLDGDFDTSWQEGAGGTGEGEWIQFSFEQPVTVVRLDIANGYQRDDRRFLGNPRIERLRVEYDDGSSQILLLEDEQGYQSFDLEPTETQRLRLVIESVYPGERWEDASMSAIQFYHFTD